MRKITQRVIIKELNDLSVVLCRLEGFFCGGISKLEIERGWEKVV
jgi:hypothetical protein